MERWLAQTNGVIQYLPRVKWDSIQRELTPVGGFVIIQKEEGGRRKL
jgi:hypothetical protein